MINNALVPYGYDFGTTKTSGLKNWFSNSGIGWNSGKGLSVKGKNLAKGFIPISLGLDAISSIGANADLQNTQDITEDMTGDILNSASSNPLANQMITSDQQDLLRNLKKGYYDTTAESDFGQTISGGLQGALPGLLLGGVPGALVGLLGGGLKSNINSKNQNQQNINAELSSLYNSLMQAEQNYNSMKSFNTDGLGLRQQYQNLYK